MRRPGRLFSSRRIVRLSISLFKMAPKRAPPGGGPATPARAGGRSSGSFSATTVTEGDSGEGGGGGAKYAKLSKLTPPKAKSDSALLVDLTRDRAEVSGVCCIALQNPPSKVVAGDRVVQADIVSRTTGEVIWAAGAMTNKRVEVNHEKAFGVKPAIVKMQELQGLVANGKERPTNRSVPYVVAARWSTRWFMAHGCTSCALSLLCPPGGLSTTSRPRTSTSSFTTPCTIAPWLRRLSFSCAPLPRRSAPRSRCCSTRTTTSSRLSAPRNSRCEFGVCC